MEPRWLVTVDENLKVKIQELANINQANNIKKEISVLKIEGFIF